MGNAYLAIHAADGHRRLPLGNEPITIGRHRDNVIVIADARASRFHSVISGTAGKWSIRDLDSANGIAVNGKMVKSAELHPGDEVLVAGTRLVFVEPGAMPAAAPKAGPAKAPELEALTEDDLVVEEEDGLSEEDVVDDDAPPELPAPEDFDQAIEEVVHVSKDADNVVDSEIALDELAESLPDKHFSDTDIALVNARGTIVHPAGKPRASGALEAVDFLRLLLLICSRSRGTDLHLEPKGTACHIRMRVDGVLVDVTPISDKMGIKMSALVKVLSEIDVADKGSVQEGHFNARVPSSSRPGSPQRRIDYRVSFAPSVFGQKLVMRVLDASYAPQAIGALKLPDWMREQVDLAVKQEAGMVLVCGPTGSGKTTTLYALVRASDVKRRNVVTIEDPVEIQMDAITQMPVDESQGKTFAVLLRSVLRQDPDVIMVGEIRDAETARIAMQAAITGHLVFSTIHTRDTLGTIFRLLDLGGEPYLVSQAIHVVIAQRLVRQLCRFCKKPVTPKYEHLSRMGDAGRGVEKIYEAHGCPRCLNTGYAGRRAFFELLTANDAFREAILHDPSPGKLQEALVVSGTPFVRLSQSGFQLVAEGVVAFDEIDRAVGREARSSHA